MVKLYHIGSLILCLLLSFAVQAVEISARLDTNEVSVGDSVKLTVTVDEQSSGKEPDFSPLNQHFEILSTVQSSTSNIINGRYSATSSWILTLLPKQKGYVAIPPIQYNNVFSKPLKLHVVKRASSTTQAEDFLFLDASVDKKEVFVQEQLIYTLRIFRADIDIFDHTYNPPDIKNGVMEQLGEQRNYQATIGGRIYNVIELQYAVFPQKSGKLDIPSAEFIGTVFRSRSRTYNFDPLNGRQVRRAAPELQINVKPKPASYPADQPWLPARSLQLEDTWSPDTGTANIGDPITRTIKITAEGLLTTILPSLPETRIKGVKIYPEQPENSSTSGAKGIISSRTVSQAIIATQAGEVELPAIDITWWDVDQQEVKVTTLPAHTLTVSGSGMQSQTDSNATPSLNTPANPKPTPTAAATTPGISSTWQWLAITFFLLWIVTGSVLLWLFLKRKKPENTQLETNSNNNETSLKAAKEELEKACQENHAHKARNAVIQVFRQHWEDSSVRNLQHISQRLAYEPLTLALDELDQHLYRRDGDSDAAWNGSTLLSIVEDSLNQPQAAPTTKEPLAPLYPV